MYFKTLTSLLIFMISHQISAQEIQVKYGHNLFQLKIEANQITYAKKDFISQVTKKDCSQKLFDDFISEYKDIAIVGEDLKKEDFMVHYEFNAIKGVVSSEHEIGQKLLSIPSRWDIFRLATEFRCKKESK